MRFTAWDVEEVSLHFFISPSTRVTGAFAAPDCWSEMPLRQASVAQARKCGRKKDVMNRLSSRKPLLLSFSRRGRVRKTGEGKWEKEFPYLRVCHTATHLHLMHEFKRSGRREAGARKCDSPHVICWDLM